MREKVPLVVEGKAAAIDGVCSSYPVFVLDDHRLDDLDDDHVRADVANRLL